jgi:hypothetical protein
MQTKHTPESWHAIKHIPDIRGKVGTAWQEFTAVINHLQYRSQGQILTCSWAVGVPRQELHLWWG